MRGEHCDTGESRKWESEGGRGSREGGGGWLELEVDRRLIKWEQG